MDDKFDVVLSELLARGWRRIESQSQANLLWTNLRSVDWDALRAADADTNADQDQRKNVVNHLHGSQHMSNKSFLAYHMEASGQRGCMPVQWSAAYQDLCELCGTALVHTLYACAMQLQAHADGTSSGGRAETKAAAATLSECRQVFHVLKADPDWGASDAAAVANQLLGVLGGGTAAAASSQLELAMSTATRLQDCGESYGLLLTWIVKPVGSGRGENITLARGTAALLDAVAAMSYTCVVQKYIERPLLVCAGRKFDIRQWLLVSSLDPLRIYGYSEFYCRLSGRRFDLSEDSLGDAVVHLCNHSVQKKAQSPGDSPSLLSRVPSADLGGGVGAGSGSMENMLSMAGLEEELLKSGMLPAVAPDNVSAASITQTVIVPQMRRISVEAVRSVRDKLSCVGAGFEWLGLDFIVTDTLQVRMLEVNVSPDISRSTPLTARLVQESVQGLLPLVLPRGNSAASNSSNRSSGEGEEQGQGQGQPGEEKAASAGAVGGQWDLWYDSSEAASSNKASNNNKYSSSSDSSAKSSAGARSRAGTGAGASHANVLQFARSKREFAILRKDYGPQKAAVLERVRAALRTSTAAAAAAAAGGDGDADADGDGDGDGDAGEDSDEDEM